MMYAPTSQEGTMAITFTHVPHPRIASRKKTVPQDDD